MASTVKRARVGRIPYRCSSTSYSDASSRSTWSSPGASDSGMRVRSMRMGTPSMDRSRSNSNSGAPGAEAERLGLVDRGRARATLEHARARREAARGRHLREAHEHVRRLADGRGRHDPPVPERATTPRRCQLGERAPERHAAHPEVLGERPFRRQPRAGRTPSALDLVRELFLDVLVAELETIERVLARIRPGRRRHAGHDRPFAGRREPIKGRGLTRYRART